MRDYSVWLYYNFMFKKNILALLIFSNLSFGNEKLPEVKLDSLKFAVIIKKEQKKEQKKEIQSTNTYLLRKNFKCTSGSVWR